MSSPALKTAVPVLLAGLIASGTAAAQSSRSYITVSGSSTVFPFATLVAEDFGRLSGFETPKIEATGSGGGIKLFCAGVGPATPDAANSSRPIKDSEREQCRQNGVADITEIRIGYDGIVLANSKSAPLINLTPRQIFLALAKEVPDAEGKILVKNPYATWADIDPSLPNHKIEVLGPPPSSGTRDAFTEIALHNGCETFELVKSLESARKKGVCSDLREDGAYIEAGEDDNLIVQRLAANPEALGIFGFSFLAENADKIQGSTINGIAPDFAAIASSDYPLSRPLFVYLKNAHIGVIPGLKEYAQAFVSDEAAGDDGYLKQAGLVPLPAEELANIRDNIDKL